MGRINVGRVLLGGLLAGLVINISETILNVVVAGQAMEDGTGARNLPPVGGSAIGGFVVITFLVGIVTVWLYAAIRPRFGPGPGTAVIAGTGRLVLRVPASERGHGADGNPSSESDGAGHGVGTGGDRPGVDRRGVGTRNSLRLSALVTTKDTTDTKEESVKF